MPAVLPGNQRALINGVVLLDKPAGLSSNAALLRVKRQLNAKKAGHTGTLDPFATGLLPLCFGEATKFAQDLLDTDKTYQTTICLGVKTSTGDTEGEVVAMRNADCLARSEIEAVLARFTGEIEQVPPMYSALKKDGRPLYAYARAGIEVQREARRVTVHEMTLLDFDAPFLSLKISCSKGTYIRTLGEDIGEALGCGAHLKTLRRIKVGTLDISDAVALPEVEQAENPCDSRILRPVDYLLSTCFPVMLSREQAGRFMHGQRLSLEKEGLHVPDDMMRVRVYAAADGKLLGTAKIRDGRVLAPERLVAA